MKTFKCLQSICKETKKTIQWGIVKIKKRFLAISIRFAPFLTKTMFLKNKYPFDPTPSHHFIIALALAIWVFIFLYFTEPLDVNEFENIEKLVYLPLYAFLGALCYLSFLPFQYYLFKKNNTVWTINQEVLFISLFCIVGILLLRLFYLYVVVLGEPNPYTFWFHLRHILLPALVTIVPIIVIGRYAFGKYKGKKQEEQKIEIEGEGNYESLRLFSNELICIKASDNYIEIFYISNNILKKNLIRNKLSLVAELFPELLRTHRSYLVNPFHFQQWKTEKNKHLLILSHSIEIPVSKTYLTKVKTMVDFTTT